MWRAFGRRAYGVTSAVLLVVGFGGLGDDTDWWKEVLTVNPALSGFLLGVGSLGLALFVAARWGDLAADKLRKVFSTNGPVRRGWRRLRRGEPTDLSSRVASLVPAAYVDLLLSDSRYRDLLVSMSLRGNGRTPVYFVMPPARHFSTIQQGEPLGRERDRIKRIEHFVDMGLAEWDGDRDVRLTANGAAVARIFQSGTPAKRADDG